MEASRFTYTYSPPLFSLRRRVRRSVIPLWRWRDAGCDSPPPSGASHGVLGQYTATQHWRKATGGGGGTVPPPLLVIIFSATTPGYTYFMMPATRRRYTTVIKWPISVFRRLYCFIGFATALVAEKKNRIESCHKCPPSNLLIKNYQSNLLIATANHVIIR